MDQNNSRILKLNKLFDSVISGKQSLTPHNGPLFLQAIYSQADPATCVNRIVASPAGLAALQSAFRFNLSPQFLNSHASSTLEYLRSPDLKAINNGEYLNDVLIRIVDPPIFWVAFREAFLGGNLDENTSETFGWLLLQLITLPSDVATPFREHSDTVRILNSLLNSTSQQQRAIGQKLKHVLDTVTSEDHAYDASGRGPGGRHDNDFADFRNISILPTGDEIESLEHPFLRPSDILEDPESESNRVPIHLDNQFRLLREDMLYEMREELQVATGKKKGYQKGIKLEGLQVVDIDCGIEDRRTKWGLVLVCKEDLRQLKSLEEPANRKKYLQDHRNILKHQSLACLLAGKEIIAFPTIERNEDLLAKNPPEIVLHFEVGESTQKALLKLKMEDDITLIQIDTALFAYEPILKGLQQAKTLPLSSEILLWKDGDGISEVEHDAQATTVVSAMRSNPQIDLKKYLQTQTTIKLDNSQAQSLISGLTRKVSLIQGPPGTGKSFIGALLAKAIHDYTKQTILVVCYTNHALDDILTSLLDIGIPAASMLRLGGKFTSRTEPLILKNQPRGARRNHEQWMVIDELKASSEKLLQDLERAFGKYNRSKVAFTDLMEHLEFDEPIFFEAFQVPESDDGMQTVGKKGKAVGEDHLFDRWCRGWDAGHFKSFLDNPEVLDVWNLPLENRRTLLVQWQNAVFQESVLEFCSIADAYNRRQERLKRSFNSNTAEILRSRRVIGCTTTAAAKYRDEIQAFNPNILLVEEAGEILESHILTSLGPETSQMILIGDHKQLRPKVNNYNLTVEKGDGFDLNRSLFERLILKNYPHESLLQQHRMRPEISSLIRSLTYPELIDAPGTQNRPNLLGVQDNIVFMHHENPEDTNKHITDQGDMASTSSKQNTFEVSMILRIIKYLAQQGYGTEKLVILTPYLGQLQKLRDALKTDNDPILNDLDSFELIRAGLLGSAQAKMTKKPIRLATIDNYQGEESDIVVVSLTRSNPNCDIGFMFSPERLNVLLSRARNALIMIGNANTFKKARKGKELWTHLFELLGQGKHIYEGFPVMCERHPNTKATIRQAEEFEVICPDGGCSMPCGTMLSCGLHQCPTRCHRLSDHSQVKCNEMTASMCSNGHTLTWPCHKGAPKTCKKCERGTRLAAEKVQQDLLAKERRDAEQQAHLDRLDAINAKIASEISFQEDARLERERARALRQKEVDLAAKIASRSTDTSQGVVSSVPPALDNTQSSPVLSNPSTRDGSDLLPDTTKKPSLLGKFRTAVSKTMSVISPVLTKNPTSTITGKPFPVLKDSLSKAEWERQKNVEGASNGTIDALMDMTGLEDVKKQVLEIKAKVDTSTRQNISLKDERFNVVLLGNPGTGKTTVARHYAKFLASVKVVSGDEFFETNGSRLSHEGVDGIKKHLDDIIKKGGGAIFVDEAYQLTSGHNMHGPAILDFLLAEMENNLGTLVFILAGYNKEMEKFFEHNPGLKSRVPYSLQFADYKDEELMSMLEDRISKMFEGRMKAEEGITGLYGRIVIRRLGRRRGQPGFGNARDLQTSLDRIRGRQAVRLLQERRDGLMPDDLFFTQEDLIGPDPSKAILQSQAWQKLQTLTGLKAVKDSIRSFINLIEENYHRELLEKEPMEVSLNRVFLGSPGTGKTTVAKLYGKVLADLGLLSNGEVVVKNPSDFVGAVLGASEANTKAILSNAVGKVLIIDEAYMLYGGGESGGGQSNQFKTTVIDTIVAEVQSVPGEDRCVLLLGYRDQMLDMFQNVNPGLSRRFKIEDAFIFDDFDDTELMEILNHKLKDQDLDATDAAKKTAIDLLSRGRNRPNFGNAGEVENLLSQAKGRCVTRRAELAPSERPVDVVFEPQDFDPEYGRAANAAANLVKLFEDVVGCDDIVERLQGYQQLAHVCKVRDLDCREQIPTNFVFTGPPGTGKTTVARKIGQVFYDMGMLASAEVIECSASDLVGQYVGQTGPKTKKLFEKALGKVLFVDEAYRLSEGHFAQEAIDELVGLLTHPTFKSKLIVILAGYEQDMNRLMSVNTGLSSRFPDQVVFRNMDAKQCLTVIYRELQKKKILLDDLNDEASAFYMEMNELVRDLSELPDWGNARDMMTLSKDMFSKALLKGGNANTMVSLAQSDALDSVKKMLADKQRRARIPQQVRKGPRLPAQSSTPNPPTPPAVGTTHAASTPPPPTPPPPPSSARVLSDRPPAPTSPIRESGRGAAPRGASRGSGDAERDPGVTDAVWRGLTAAKRAAERIAREAKSAIIQAEQAIAAERRKEEEQKKILITLAKAKAEAQEADRRAAIQREIEEARRKESAARAARERAAADLRAKKEAERQRKEREVKAQQKLRQMGVCPVGFQWVNRGSYYQCTGGSHIVQVDQLGL
ncbi:P-loop containing nucleoside triphosphate hydrolase protein [Crassisporium funariophilum]|nr:P-loop containing nucleoside triphosphate hydrolase protein [Crassisporium funariophilum]